MPVMISRSGRCPWRTSRWRPSSVSLSAWPLSKAATSASTACASKRSRAVAQNLGQRIGKSSWLGELENVSLGHGVSLLRWRSGGVKHPHDTPPYPFMPSPTFAHSSIHVHLMRFQRQRKRTPVVAARDCSSPAPLSFYPLERVPFVFVIGYQRSIWHGYSSQKIGRVCRRQMAARVRYRTQRPVRRALGRQAQRGRRFEARWAKLDGARPLVRRSF